jgi:hypothetical protein
MVEEVGKKIINGNRNLCKLKIEKNSSVMEFIEE